MKLLVGWVSTECCEVKLCWCEGHCGGIAKLKPAKETQMPVSVCQECSAHVEVRGARKILWFLILSESVRMGSPVY